MIELKQTKVSVIDTMDCGYNGTIAKLNDYYIFFYRRGGGRIQSSGKILGFPDELKFTILNKKFEPLSHDSIFSTGYSVEDPRIIETDNGFKLFTTKDRRIVVQNINLGSQESEIPSISVSNPIQLKAQHFKYLRVEKNWVPFEHEDSIYFIYCTQPYVVLVSNAEEDCRIIYKEKFEFEWNYGRISGGTPAVRISEDEYLTFFHSFTSKETASWIEPRQYHVGAYTFEARPPFKIKKITKLPLTWKGLLETSKPNNQNKIVFPSGLILDGKNLIMSYGENDNWNFVLEVPLEAVLQEMSER